VNTDEAVWVTVAYIPIVRKMKEPGAANRARKRRCGLLQRVLFLAFRSAVASSNVGTDVQWGERGLKLFARILLYICDLPEEKAVLCLKGGKCSFPCSMCDVSVYDAGAVKVLTSEDRDALILLRRQLEGAGHRVWQRESQRRLHLESTSSAHSEVPMMAAMGGLASRPFLMYKMVGFDALHVSLLALCVKNTYTLVEQPHAWVAPMILSQLSHPCLDCSFFLGALVGCCAPCRRLIQAGAGPGGHAHVVTSPRPRVSAHVRREVSQVRDVQDGLPSGQPPL